MTLIKFNQIAQASGKMNGTIFARNSSGQYMKTLQKPVNKRSILQDTQRTIISALTKQWSLLSDGQRNGWNDLALVLPKMNRVGVAILRSGFNVFVEFNVNLRTIGVTTLIEDAPAKPVFPYEIETLALNGDIGADLLVANCSLTEKLPVGTSYYYIIRTTGIISMGRKSVSGIKKILTYEAGVDDEISTQIDIKQLFVDKYGRFPSINDSIACTAQLVLADFPCTNLQKLAFSVIVA